jgi:type I restriction enzyme S subunit
VTLLRGVSTSKVLIKSVANVTDLDFSSYKIVKTNQFVYVSDTSRRGEKIGLALNTGADCIVSSIYTVFEVKDLSKLIPEFLMLWFKRPEFDRYSRYNSWGSARETFNWEDMCDIELPIPDDINLQKSVVAAYNGLLKNQSGFENSLSDLQLICDSFMENQVKKNGLKTLGEFIQQSEHKNYDLPLSKVRGVSIRKVLINTKANMTDVDTSGYKLLKKGQFVFVPNTARMGDKIAISLNAEQDYIVSKIYEIFEIKKNASLLPEYLFLWFAREEFDRYARFHSWGSVREAFSWEDMCAVKLPIPDIETQKSIVLIHHALESRKRINENLKNMITPLCPILMKGVIDNLAIN